MKHRGRPLTEQEQFDLQEASAIYHDLYGIVQGHVKCGLCGHEHPVDRNGEFLTTTCPEIVPLPPNPYARMLPDGCTGYKDDQGDGKWCWDVIAEMGKLGDYR